MEFDAVLIASRKEKMLKEAQNLIDTFNFSPTLYNLLIK